MEKIPTREHVKECIQVDISQRRKSTSQYRQSQPTSKQTSQYRQSQPTSVRADTTYIDTRTYRERANRIHLLMARCHSPHDISGKPSSCPSARPGDILVNTPHYQRQHLTNPPPPIPRTPCPSPPPHPRHHPHTPSTSLHLTDLKQFLVREYLFVFPAQHSVNLPVGRASWALASEIAQTKARVTCA